MATQTTCKLFGGAAFKASEMAWKFYMDRPYLAREFLKGLKNAKPPFGYTRGSFEVKHMGTFSYNVPTVPMLANITATLDWQEDDALQRELQNRGKCGNDFFRDAIFYMRRSKFDRTKDIILWPDFVANPESGMSVLNFDIPSVGPDDPVTATFEMTQNITWIYCLVQIPETVPALPEFVYASPGGGDTITRTTGSWTEDGLQIGMHLVIDEEFLVTALGLNNKKIVEIVDLSATVITTVEDGYLTPEAGLGTYWLRAGWHL